MSGKIPLESISEVTVQKVKMVVLGDSGTGKTSIAVRYAKGEFDPHQKQTLAASFIRRVLTIRDVELHFQIWDTAGQEKYMSLVPMYIRGAQVALIVFDVTNIQSFEHVDKWLRALDKYTDCLCKVLVANKADLHPKVSMLRAEIFATERDLAFVQTSAKTGFNIDRLFHDIGCTLVEKVKRASNRESRDIDSITSVAYAPKPYKKSKCCRL